MSSIQNLFDELDTEIKTNVDIFNKMKKTAVEFGHNIQFEHVNSNKYLSFHPEQNNLGVSDNFV